MERHRKIAWLVAGVAAVTLALTMRNMAGAIIDYNKRTPRTTYFFQDMKGRELMFAGRKIEFIDEKPGEAGWTLLVKYDGEELRLPVTVPNNPKLPGLAAHADWLSVQRFVGGQNVTAGELADKMRTGELKDRLVVVTRTPMPGAERGAWADVWRKDWSFDFYEFQEDGTISRERWKWPTGGPSKAPKEGELQPDSWQLQAACSVMPLARRPNIKFTSDGLDAMGRTLPIAAWSIMALVVSIAVAVAPARRVREAASTPGAAV